MLTATYIHLTFNQNRKMHPVFIVREQAWCRRFAVNEE